ncbi:hypothetical protein DL98DRAFT_539106 [Cadophora sp. DSE1049]|nr:hypothetical protein DL98DRAFT_539106 [Cadophora sp. DSE1049]
MGNGQFDAFVPVQMFLKMELARLLGNGGRAVRTYWGSYCNQGYPVHVGGDALGMVNSSQPSVGRGDAKSRKSARPLQYRARPEHSRPPGGDWPASFLVKILEFNLTPCSTVIPVVLDSRSFLVPSPQASIPYLRPTIYIFAPGVGTGIGMGTRMEKAKATEDPQRVLLESGMMAIAATATATTSSRANFNLPLPLSYEPYDYQPFGTFCPPDSQLYGNTLYTVPDLDLLAFGNNSDSYLL